MTATIDPPGLTIWVFPDDPAFDDALLARWRSARHTIEILDVRARRQRLGSEQALPDVIVYGALHLMADDRLVRRCREEGALAILVSDESPAPGSCDHHVRPRHTRRSRMVA